MSGIIGGGRSKSGIINRFYAGDASHLYGGWDGFMAYNTTTSWTSIDDLQTVPFTHERHDNSDNYNTSLSRYYAKNDGLYYFQASIYTGEDDTANSFGFIYNGDKDSNIIGSHHQNWGHTLREDATDMIQFFSMFMYLKKNENCRIVVMNGSADFYPGHSHWSGHRIR